MSKHMKKKSNGPKSEKVDPSAVVNSITVPEKIMYKCACCGKEVKRPNGVFPKTRSPLFAANNNYGPICYSCLLTYYESLTQFYKGDEDEACNRICQLIDVYYNKDAFSTVRYVSNGYHRLSQYISKLNTAGYDEKTSYLDTLVDQQRDVILSMDAIDESGVSASDVLKWGLGLTADEYKFLNAELEDWENRCVVEGKSRESCIKDICMLTLQQNKALREGRFDLYQKLTETRQKSMDKAELTPKIATSKDRETEKPIGVMIRMFEEERPISKPRPEWEDVDGIRKLILIYFIGHLCKMLGLRNKYATMYEEEMAKYRADIPELEDADTEDVFEYIMENNISRSDDYVAPED